VLEIYIVTIAQHLNYLNELFSNQFIDENMLEFQHEKILSFHNFFSFSTIFFLAEFSLAHSSFYRERKCLGKETVTRWKIRGNAFENLKEKFVKNLK
jgi:hypothetical protein